MSWLLSRYRAGEFVEVRSAAEILATLDEDGCVDGMPFMPEMLQFCGRRLRVRRLPTRHAKLRTKRIKGAGSTRPFTWTAFGATGRRTVVARRTALSFGRTFGSSRRSHTRIRQSTQALFCRDLLALVAPKHGLWKSAPVG